MRKAWTTPSHGLQNDQFWTSAQGFKKPTRTFGDFKKSMNRGLRWAIAHKSTTFQQSTVSWEVLKPPLRYLTSGHKRFKTCFYSLCLYLSDVWAVLTLVVLKQSLDNCICISLCFPTIIVLLTVGKQDTEENQVTLYYHTSCLSSSVIKIFIWVKSI